MGDDFELIYGKSIASSLSNDNLVFYTEIVQKYQRDINCMIDPNRTIRRKSLEKLLELIKSTNYNDIVKHSFYESHLKDKLFNQMEDTVEKCRELSLLIMHTLIDNYIIKDVISFLNSFLINVNKRVGNLPYIENSEEIRILMIQLLIKLIEQIPMNCIINDSVILLINILTKLSADPFPESKRAICNCIILISKKFPLNIKWNAGKLIKAIILNLSHQHSKIRIETLRAMKYLIPTGIEGVEKIIKEDVLPILEKVANSHVPSVFTQIIDTIGYWLITINNDCTSELYKRLFPILLLGATSENENTQKQSFYYLDCLNDIWDKKKDEIQIDFVNDHLDMTKNNFLPPFNDRPKEALRLLSKKLFPLILPNLLVDICDWTPQKRSDATKILRMFIILIENTVNISLIKIINSLSKICRDEESDVVTHVAKCAAAIGFYADSTILFASLLPMVSGTVAGQDSAFHQSNGLVLLSMCIQGMSNKTIQTHLKEITECLVNKNLLQGDSLELHTYLSEVLYNLIKVAETEFIFKNLNENDLIDQNNHCFYAFWIINQTMAISTETTECFSISNKSLELLSKINKCQVKDIYIKYFGKTVQEIKCTNELDALPDIKWTKNHPNRILFDFLCRNGIEACIHHIDLVISIILPYMDSSVEADLRLSFIALLETLLGNERMKEAFIKHNKDIILIGIMPNIIWKAGRVNSTVRKVAMACIYTLLRHEIADKICLYAVTPKLLPILKTCLDDNDYKTRQLVLLSLQYLFAALPRSLGEEPVHELYVDLLKRLDDSNNIVREAACITFKMFLQAAPKEYFHGTILNYSMDCLFIHLDDSEHSIQEAVFEVLKEMITIDSDLIIKKASENRPKHRSPLYCDQLIKLSTTCIL